MAEITKKKRKRCYTYVRVSTEMQVEGYSLDSQRDRLKREAKAKDWTIVKEYADEGKSGHSIAGRPKFKEMLERIKSGNPDNVDFVLVYKLSRFGRNAADALASLKQMRKHGVELYCAEESIDSTGGPGYLMITIMAAVAEIERENILVQTMAGRHQKAREGKWNGGQAPYGYKINSETGVLEIDEEEAEIVRLMFDQFVNYGLGINGVARWLEANGYRKKLRGNGKYTLFSAHTVKTIIDNPVYVGKIAYGRRRVERIEDEDEETEVVRRLKNDEYGLYDGKHEAIISEELWEEAQEKRNATSVKHEKTHSLDHEHILSGILRCPICGAPMYGTVNRKKKKDGSGEYYKDAWYYVCKHRKLIDGQKCTYRRQPPQGPINDEVIAIVREAMMSPELVEGMQWYANMQINTDELEKRLEELEKSKSQKMRAKDRLSSEMDALDTEDDAVYEMEYSDLQLRQKALYAEIAEISMMIHDTKADLQKQADAVTTVEVARKLMEEAGNELMAEHTSDLGKKLMLQAMVEKVDLFPERLDNGRYVKGVTFKFPVMLEGEMTDQWWYKQNPVETVCLLSKLHEAKHHINVKVNMDELDLTSAEAKATYKEIEEWVQEHYGFHVTNLNIAQVKQKHGIIERENYNKPKSEDSRQPGCPEEKIKAIEDALQHFRMI